MINNIKTNLFIENCPNGVIIDVRTPAEYNLGHIVGAINIPLFTNEERAIVGTIYKQQSKEKAIEKGLEFVGPKMADIVKSCRKILKETNKNMVYLYCWRGGMRSNSVGWLLQTAGIEVSVLKGGYKAYRSSFIEALKTNKWRFMIIGGPTGCGKTHLLKALSKKGEQTIDLEEIAKHKGSAFGKHGFNEEQPSSEHFANILYHELLKLNPSQCIWCEGESISIGHIFMPQEMYELMQKAPLVYYEIPLKERVNIILSDYGTCPKEELKECFTKIKKRLGYDRAQKAINAIDNNDLISAIEIAITYYDKGYSKSMSNRSGETINNIYLTDYNLDDATIKFIKTRIEYEKNN